MKDVYAYVATVLVALGYGPYLYKTITRKVAPHPFTWFVWSCISAITLFGQIAKGAGIGALPTAAAEILTITIFLASLRNGMKYVRKTDTYFLIFALLGLIPWLIFRDPTISVVIAVLVDVIAFGPTIRKSWQNPKSESKWVYITNVIRHIVSLMALRTYNIATVIHSIAMIITNTATTITLLISRYKNKRKPANGGNCVQL